MVDLLGLFVAILAIFLSICWLKKGQKATTETTVSKPKDEVNQKEEDPKQQQLPQPFLARRYDEKKPKPKTQPSTTKKNKHQIPSDPRFLRRYGGHAGTVTAFSASPDGRWLATAGKDGQVRVAKVDNAGFNLSATVKSPGMGVFQDHLSAISWLPSCDSHPTVVGAIDKSRQIAFYRIRRRKDATAAGKAANSSGQYELIELAKRRFDLSGKVDDSDRVVACLADQSHDSSGSDCLVLTKTDYDPKRSRQKHPNTVAWSGGHAAGTVNTNSPGIRLSPDGSFLCGRGGIGAPEAKIFEVRRKKVKGESEPVFDSIPSRSAMTLVPATTGAKVADVAFCGERDNLKQHHASLGVLACEDGSVEVWNLDVDHRAGEDPKFLSSARVFGDGDGTNGKKIVCIAAASARNDGDGRDGDAAFYRIAVATSDSALHLLTHCNKKSELSVDFSIEYSAHKGGVGELQFCPFSGNYLYSTGKDCSRDVYSWKVS